MNVDLLHLVEVVRELWRSPGPTLLLELVAQDCVQTALTYLQDGDSTASQGNPLPGLKHQH